MSKSKKQKQNNKQQKRDRETGGLTNRQTHWYIYDTSKEQ